jgi:hypothetical protein
MLGIRRGDGAQRVLTLDTQEYGGFAESEALSPGTLTSYGKLGVGVAVGVAGILVGVLVGI